MTIKELENSKEYYLHHTATRRGYESRKTDGVIKEYNGRFGTGYIIVRPRFDTTQYVFYEYYIRKEG